MIERMAIVALGWSLVVTAGAQQPGPERGWGEPADAWGPRPWLNRMLEGFDHELHFNEQQWAQLDAIVAAQEARAHAAMARWHEMGQAGAVGDEARAAELRAQLQQEFDARESGMKVMFDEIESVLHEDQRVRFQDMRRRMQQWQDHGRQMWQAVRELPDAVEMTEEQRQQYQALLRDRWQAMQEEMRQRAEQNPAGMQWETPDFAALEDAFYAQVAELLNEEQRTLLGQYRLQFATEAPPPDAQQADDVRLVLQAMKRVRGLSSAQYDSLRAIERDARASYQGLHRERDKQRLAELASQVKARILEVLTPEQAEQFRGQLERLQPRRARR